MKRVVGLSVLAVATAVTALTACSAAASAPAGFEAAAADVKTTSEAMPPPGTAVPAPSATVAAQPATMIEPLVACPVTVSRHGDTVSLKLPALTEVRNAQFDIVVNGRPLAFMAYIVRGQLQVRAGACPSCESSTYLLDGDFLDCVACDSRYDALTGDGASGGCMDYPKKPVPCDTVGDLVVMKIDDLVRAWDETSLLFDNRLVT